MSNSSGHSAHSRLEHTANHRNNAKTKPTPKRSQYIRKACQECKRRKVKCDGQDPCGRCRAQLIWCAYRAHPQDGNLLELNSGGVDITQAPTSGIAVGRSHSDPELALDISQKTFSAHGLSLLASAAASNEEEGLNRTRSSRDHGRIKSCTQCRLHKMKCTTSQHPGEPCSRCLKMGLSCVVTRSGERIKHRTKAQLTLENEELRKRLHEHGLHPGHPVRTTPVANVQKSAHINSLIDDPGFMSLDPEQIASGGNPDPAIATSVNVDFPGDPHELLDGLSMPSTNYCLQLFFKNYASFLPGIFPTDIPFMTYHSQSPFLFWTMACTGARRFYNLAYFQQATSKVRELVTASLLQLQDPIPTIQAVLILCLWPLPVDSGWKDISHTLAGAAMQLAVQNGLHKFRHEQDFRSTQMNNSDRNTRVFRIHLWLNCVILFQRTSICDGLPFSSTLDSWPAETETSLKLIDNERLVVRYRLHRLQIRAIATLTQAHDIQEAKGCKGISALINIFDAQVQEIDASTTDTTLHMAANFTRLSLLAFHLFSPDLDDVLPGAICLFTVCTEILDLAARLDATQCFAWYSTHYHLRMILLTAFCVLRILRSSLRALIPINEAEQALYKAIGFVKSRSTQPTDLDAKYAVILRQLYASTTAFKRADGVVDGLCLGVRSRLFMSIAFDSFQWWRAEFDGRPNISQSPAPIQAVTVDDSTEPDPAMHGETIGAEMGPFAGNFSDIFSSYEEFLNWHWPAALTFEDEDNMPAAPLY